MSGLIDQVKSHGLQPRKYSVEEQFGGVGGSVTSNVYWEIPIGIRGKHGILGVYEVARDIPGLLSNADMAAL